MARTEYRLKGHESFIPREGWITKGLFAVKENPNVFAKENYYGADALGVGVNMAKSIRYWMNVMGLSKKIKGEEKLTELGELLLEKDPFLDDLMSLYVLHEHLVTNRKQASSWYLFFQHPADAELTREEFQNYIGQQLLQEFNIETYTEKSLKDDVNAILNMYGDVDLTTSIDPEENSISPFVRLHLIHKNTGRFSNCEPQYERMPVEVILYFIYRLLEKNGGGCSISIETLYQAIGGVKNTIHMNYVNLNDMLDQLASRGLLRVDRTAGLDVIYVKERSSLEVLKEYY